MARYDTVAVSSWPRIWDRPAVEMRARRLTPDEAGLFSRSRLAPAPAGQLERLRRRGHHTPAYDA
jgi:hypothetical protein